MNVALKALSVSGAAIMIASTLLASTPSRADNLSSGDIALCSEMTNLAGIIMKSRQAGVDMSVLMERTTDPKVGDFAGLVRAIIIDAYDAPRYASQGMRDGAVIDFRNDFNVECLKTKLGR